MSDVPEGHVGTMDDERGREHERGENPERQGPGPAPRPDDEPAPSQPDTAEPPPESAPGDSGEVSTPRR